MIDKLGSFKPKTFKTVFKWKVDEIIPVENLSTSIRIIAMIDNHKLTVISHPYSYGEFTAEVKTLGFGGKNFWLKTTDPEKAIQLTERFFKRWLDEQNQIVNKLLDYFK